MPTAPNPVTEPPAATEGTWRVFVVEDHAGVRRGFNLLLNFEDDLTVCGEAADVNEALAGIRDSHPDIALVDLALQGSNGLDLIPQLRLECPHTRILVVSMCDQAARIKLALHAGADGYLTKEESSEQLVHAIHQIRQGNRFLSQKVCARLAE